MQLFAFSMETLASGACCPAPNAMQMTNNEYAQQSEAVKRRMPCVCVCVQIRAVRLLRQSSNGLTEHYLCLRTEPNECEET